MSGISREKPVNEFFVSCQSVLITETPLSVGIFIEMLLLRLIEIHFKLSRVGLVVLRLKSLI